MFSYSGAESQGNPVSATETAAARPRQRRIGHSGPPTGNFQLYGDSGGDSSSNEEEDQNSARSR